MYFDAVGYRFVPWVSSSTEFTRPPCQQPRSAIDTAEIMAELTTKNRSGDEGYKITAADAFDMRNRIFLAGSFLKLLHLSEKAVPFSSVYFDLSSYDHVGYFDFQDLLKEWVSSSVGVK